MHGSYDDEQDDRRLYRAVIQKMPNNPTRQIANTSGLHRVLVYKRRSATTEAEDFAYLAGENLEWQEALSLSGKLNRGGVVE